MLCNHVIRLHMGTIKSLVRKIQAYIDCNGRFNYSLSYPHTLVKGHFVLSSCHNGFVLEIKGIDLSIVVLDWNKYR